MPFTPLEQPDDMPRRGFTPLGDGQPKRGFTPLQDAGEQPSILKMAALENPATAIAETGLNLASQAVALPVAGIAGLATEAWNALGLTEHKGADVVHAMGDALTYQPRGEMGKQATEIATYPFQKLAEAGQWAGGKTLDATGSPALATAVDTAIQGVLPMVAGPMAKKGGSAIRERFSKPETGAEAIAPDAQATNLEAINGQVEQGASGLVRHDPELPRSAPEAVSDAVRTDGYSGLPGMAEELPAVSERRGSGAESAALAVSPERAGELRAGELRLDDPRRADATPDLLQEGVDSRQGYDAGRGFAPARDASEVDYRVPDGERDVVGQPSGQSPISEFAVDHARRVEPSDLRMGETLGNRPGDLAQANQGRMANRSGAEPGIEARPQPVIDPSAGPLSRSAAVARPDLVIKAETAKHTGPFGDLGQDAGTVREPIRPAENREWVRFADESGTLGVPRAEMPQIKAEHRGAMTQFMNARGIKHRAEEVRADTLKATQAEFSPAKVRKALGFEGGERSILVSADGYILDGHHQWLAKREAGEPIKVIRFDAPIADLFALAHDFPSSRKANGAAGTQRGFTPLAETQRAAQPGTEFSFAPGANYAPLIDDSRAPAGTAPATAVGRDKPIRREDIIVPFAKDLGASIYSGRVKMKNALGFFRRGNEEVRIKRHADLEVTAHEMAHLIDARVPELSREWRSNSALRNPTAATNDTMNCMR